MSEIVKVKYKDGHVHLVVPDFKDIESINIEKVTRIDETKMLAEIITFPVILNRLGLVLAEAESEVGRANMELKIGKAKLRLYYRKNPPEGIKVTNDTVDDLVRVDPKYRAYNIKHINAMKRKDIVNSAYWSAKDKSDKLNKLSEKWHPDELVVDAMIDEINGIKIVIKKNLID